MDLVSMKLTKAEAKAEASIEYKPPEYPYGLKIDLDNDALEKLGIAQLPEIGTPMTVTARCEVCSVSAYESQGQDKKQRNLQLQITDLGLSPATSTQEETANALYGTKAS